ncbi:tyrosine-type recombinase/integrase [Candidiatus Paracoxiella cheracis]|uniref:tyrosine-type recombinase/integrase n=1 Tax=Candidiatus Paracoxiella cheracis TaxID=3405120 RepID=UPI003BF4F20D
MDRDGNNLSRASRHAWNTTGWQAARVRAGLSDVRVHDLRHTFGRCLRAMGVSYEDRQDLLGHKSGRMTTHYSSAEIRNLIESANLICQRRVSTPTLRLIRSQVDPRSRKSPARIMAEYEEKRVG